MVRELNPAKRNFILTLHGSKQLLDKAYNSWKTLTTHPDVKYLSYQYEPTEEGKPHIQAYLETAKIMRYTSVQKLLGAKVHCESRRGTRQQARDYSLKTEETLKTYPKWKDHGVRLPGTEPVEIGEFKSKQGSRSDLNAVAESIMNDMPLKEIMETYPGTYLRYHKCIKGMIADKRMMAFNKRKRYQSCEVHIIHGKAGTGKDQTVYDMHGNDVYELSKDAAGAVWFDGYQGEKVLLIADFRGWIQYSQLLNLTSGRPQRLNIKGGTEWSQWKKVYITSNDLPNDWYERGLCNAFKSRVKSVTEYRLEDKRDEVFELPKTKIVKRKNYRKIQLSGGSVLPATSVTVTCNGNGGKGERAPPDPMIARFLKNCNKTDKTRGSRCPEK